MRCWANQFSRGGNNLQGECLYRLGENQQQATFKHLLQTDPNLSIEPLHDYDQTALFVVPFPPPPSPLRGAADFRFSRKPVPSSFEEKEEEEAKSVSARGEQTSEDKVRARPASTIFTLDTQIYLAPILNLDLRSSSSLKASVIYFSIEEFYPRREEFSVYVFSWCLLRPSVSLSIFFFFRSKGEEKSAMSEELNVYFFPLLDLSLYYFVSKGRISFFIFHTYRLLIDEVENNVKILKLISKLSERYEISDGE